MPLADRDYQQQPSNMRGGGFLSHLPPVVKWLLITNVAIFLLDYLLLPLIFNIQVDLFNPPPIASFGAFSISSAFGEFRVWELFTFQFMHANILHIAFNSIGLYFFGPWMERWWGSTKFLAFYLISGAGGALFYALLYYTGVLDSHPDSTLVGASAGIFGILIGVAMIAPNLRVQLIFPPIELTMRQLSIGILAFAVIKILFNMNNAGGEAGHLGGAILGFIMMKFPQLLSSNNHITIEPPRSAQYRSESKLRPRSELNLNDDPEVDTILEKISDEGFQSLTEEEKEILKKAAEKQNE